MQFSKVFSLIVIALLVAVVFAGLVTIPAAAQTDTMQFHYNAQHTGDYSPVAGSVPSNGQLKWSYHTTGSYLACSPAVANGVVYIGSGWPDGNVYGLYANNGTKLWSYQTGSYVQSSPAVANGVVYVGSDDHNVYGLFANNGTKLWSFGAGGYVDSSPAIANGVVYVGSSGSVNDQASNLYALYANNGTKLWNYTAEDWIVSSPAVASGVVYVGSNDRNIYALYANNGTKVWNFTTGDTVYSSPAVANGVVYVGSGDNKLYALYANNGTELWNYTTGGRVDSSPAVANGVVYVQSSSGIGSNNLYALDAQTSTKLWNYTTGGGVYSSPAVVNGVVYVGSYDNNVYAIGTQPVSKQTTLTISAPSLAAINKPFALSGTLKTNDGTPIAGATIQLQKNVSGKWTNVAGKTNVTTSTGAYRISISEPTAGTNGYRTTCAGKDTFASATSPVVSVKVVSKASVLADLNALRLTVIGIPSSAFIPGTKVATFAVISAAEINLRVGSYNGAKTELQYALLARMDGCAKTGKPDSNDWVRTCAAQRQLYPQVQNLIKELQAL